MVNVFVKGVDGEAYKKAKIMAIRENESMGCVISEAIEALEERKKEKTNNLDKALGFFGRDDKALAEERRAARRIRKEIGKDLERRISRYESAGY